MFSGIIVPVFMVAIEFQGIESQPFKVLFLIILVFSYISPLYVFSDSLFNLVLFARLNSYCVLNQHLCPDLFVNDESFSTAVCCGKFDF